MECSKVAFFCDQPQWASTGMGCSGVTKAFCFFTLWSSSQWSWPPAGPRHLSEVFLPAYLFACSLIFQQLSTPVPDFSVPVSVNSFSRISFPSWRISSSTENCFSFFSLVSTVTDNLLAPSGGLDAAAESIIPGQGCWSQDVISNLDNESGMTKVTLDPLVNTVINPAAVYLQP